MTRDKAAKLANEMLRLYGLSDWTAFCSREDVHFYRAHIYNAKGEVVHPAAGFCVQRDKIICIHPRAVERGQSYDDVVNLILHEIAHALTPNDHHHGSEWKNVAQQIGSKHDGPFSGRIKRADRLGARKWRAWLDYMKQRQQAK